MNESQNPIKHPIFQGKAKVKIKSVDADKGKWIDKSEWQELTVEFEDGTTLKKIRHRSSVFDAIAGQKIVIVWVIPKNDNHPWYYSNRLNS